MPRKSSQELVAEARSAMQKASEALLAGDTQQAANAALEVFHVARAQRSDQLVSDTWLFLLDTLAADPDSIHTVDYRDHVEGAFYWAETMPEEIQVWLFPALVPHLERLGFRRLVERANMRSESATGWLQRGNLNVRTRIQQNHLDDLANGRSIDPRALAMERMAAFYADELFDPEAELLRQAGRLLPENPPHPVQKRHSVDLCRDRAKPQNGIHPRSRRTPCRLGFSPRPRPSRAVGCTELMRGSGSMVRCRLKASRGHGKSAMTASLPGSTKRTPGISRVDLQTTSNAARPNVLTFAHASVWECSLSVCVGIR